jgi:hypothetical protein
MPTALAPCGLLLLMEYELGLVMETNSKIGRLSFHDAV